VTERVIDACIHHRWSQVGDIHPYFEADWKHYVGTPRVDLRPLVPRFRYQNPRGEELRSAMPADGSPAGSTYQQVAEQALAPDGVERALLVFDQAMFTPALSNPYLATAAVKAINDWNAAEWLAKDDRLYGVALIPIQVPDEAAAEIRRVGSNPKIAGVLIAAGIGKLLGHPIYHPIYAAAAELDLPVLIHRGIDGIAETEQSSGPAGGPPMTFAEYDSIAPVAVMSQLMSLITNGVFAKFPKLRVCVAGAGVAWAAGWMRRMDLIWNELRREVPWMQRSPAEYMANNVRICTFGLEQGSAAMLRGMLEANPTLRELVFYGSGWPNWDTAGVDVIKSIFPEDWHSAVLRENAEKWFRWSRAGVPATP
jgi:predicted TIM-barrel fold metal-dependent hydrolase